MTPEREAKERELFLAKHDGGDGIAWEAWNAWLARAEIAAETEAENVRLRAALAAYGQHKSKCRALDAFNIFEDPHELQYIPVTARKCTCGLEAALAPNENELKRINIIGMTAEKVVDTGMTNKRINPDVLAKELGAATHEKEATE